MENVWRGEEAAFESRGRTKGMIMDSSTSGWRAMYLVKDSKKQEHQGGKIVY